MVKIKSTIKILSLFFALSFLTARFAFILDDPDHLLHPHPDCQLCQQKDVQFLTDSYKIVLNNLFVIEIIEIQLLQKFYFTQSYYTYFIRPPPVLNFSY
jgi:hypothetical protein